MPAMVLGIVSLVALPVGCCCGVGSVASIAAGIAAIAFGVTARNRVAAAQGSLGGGSKATAGIVMGGIAIGLAVALLVLGFALGLGSGAFLNYLNSIASPTP